MFGFLLFRTDPNEFVADRYGPTERRRRQLVRENRWWRKHLRWIAAQPWPLRVIIVLAWITVAVLAFILGAFLGLAFRFAVGY